MTNPFRFQPAIRAVNYKSKSVLDLLPNVNRTKTVENFFTASVNHLFTPGRSDVLDGFIGTVPNWNNPVTDHYIPEPTRERAFYQLSPLMVSKNPDSNTYTNILFYTDLINQIGFQGAKTDNHSRLFDQNYVTWCPYVDLDKFVNYRKYWWNPAKSSYPDYITISKKSADRNPWSKDNDWIHESDLTDDAKTFYVQAVRPIIEFLPNIELFNYGRYRRQDTDLVVFEKTNVQEITGRNYVRLDGIELHADSFNSSGIRFLVTNDEDHNFNNKVYGLNTNNGTFIVTTESDGQDPYGSPILGEITQITSGTHALEEYWFDGSSWVLAQSKQSINQFPLFRLYDTNNHSLDDQIEYPNTTFSGSKVFGYNIGTTSDVTDNILGFPLTRDVNGQIQFKDYLAQDTYFYTENLETFEIKGYYFINIMSDEGDLLTNHWWDSPYVSRQMVVDEFTANGLNKAFTLSQTPDEKTGVLPNIIVEQSTTGTDGVTDIISKTLVEGQDYLRDGNKIIIDDISEGDAIRVKTYSSSANQGNGFYEVPVNLKANPTNQPINLVSVGDVYAQFSEIISNQVGFSGQVSNINNWHSLEKYDLSLGTKIIQNESSMLPLMLTCSDTNLDIGDAIRFASDAYMTFKAKFESRITEYFTQGTFPSRPDMSDLWIDNALADISKGMTNTSAFYNSAMGVTGTHRNSYFIPPTPAFLGMMPLHKPEKTKDYTIPTTPDIIVGHDGSTTICFGDFRDQVILDLETRLYNSVPNEIKNKITPSLTVDDWVESGTYKGQYTRDEFLSLIQSEFDRFTLQNNLPKYENVTYDAGNPFSYNWSSVQSKIDGEMLPGTWRAIFFKYYGTDRPHTAPWEMFGFVNEPSWWRTRYGNNFDPNDNTEQNYYTSDNKILWNDVKNGFIAQGPRKGTYAKYARPDIYSMIPVDHQGYLLDPFQCGIAKNYPEANEANANWKFGDQGSVESIWKRSSSYQFAVLLALYLMKPSRFVSTFWDSLDYKLIQEGTISEQSVNSLLGRRDQFKDLFVHGETNDGFVQRYGIQQFISNKLMDSNKDITKYLGDPLRHLDVRLGHKMSGFTDSTDNTIITDTNDIVPDNNVSTLLYTSPAIKNSFYSGVIITRETDGFRIYGYNNFDPEFHVIYPNTNMGSETISVGDVKANLVHKWKPNTYYAKGIIVRTDDGSFYVCIKNHTSALTFEGQFWQPSTRQDYSSKTTVSWYKNGNDENKVTVVPYGTHFDTVQEVVNFLNGLQRKQVADGWKFNVVEDGTVNDWSSAANQFLNWKIKSDEVGSFISLSPLANSATFETDIGEIQNIEQIINGQYGIVDKSGLSIEPYNISVEREDGKVTLIPKDQGIFGVKVYVNAIEHVLVFDNTTVFGDVIYNPVMNVYQPRLKFQGYRTQDWNGRLFAPGFIISGNKLVPNFEKTADDFRHYFNVESLDNDSLQKRARANIGFSERTYMSNLAIGPTNQFEFYQGMIQDKGTPSVFRKIMRSNIVRGSKNLSYHEEWAFRIGTYGADEIRPSVVFNISHSDIKNDPQLIEFNTIEVDDEFTYKTDYWFWTSQDGTIGLNGQSVLVEEIELRAEGLKGTFTLSGSSELVKAFDTSKDYLHFVLNKPIATASQLRYRIDVKTGGKLNVRLKYRLAGDSFASQTTSNTITLTDVKSKQSGKFIVKDSRWIQRFSISDIKWPTKNFPQITPGFFPNAGYVNVDTVNFTATNANSFYTLFSDVERDNEATSFTSRYNFTKTGGGDRVTVVDAVKSQQDGFFRVNRIVVTINKAPLVATTINIGTGDQLPDGYNNTWSSSLIARVTNEDLTGSQSAITLYPSAFWKLGGKDNTLKIQVCMDDTSSIPSNISLADIDVEIDVDWIRNQVLPGNRAWVYDLGIGDWGTFALKDTGFKINHVDQPSFDGQGAVVSLQGYETNPQNILGESLIVLSGIQNISPAIDTIIKPKFSNSVSVAVDGTSKVPLMKFVPDAGMQIESLTINVLKPFTTTDGTDLDFDIGTEKNNNLLTQSSVLSNPSPTKPDFSASVPVTVKLANPTVTISNSSQSVDIHVVRYGNIYGIPQGCGDLPVTSVNWEYSKLDDNGNPTSWSFGGNIAFGNPQSQTDIKETFWHMVGSFDYQKDSGNYAIRLTNAQNAQIDQTILKIKAESEPTATSFNPTKVSLQKINTDLFNINNDNDELSVSVGKNTTGLAIVTLSYTYNNGFEVTDINGKPLTITDEGNGGNVLTWLRTRYRNRADANQSHEFSQLPDGTYVELDNETWEIGKKNGNYISSVWFQSEKIISSQLKSAILYNNNTGYAEQELEVYDPYKGLIPSTATSEIEYILEYDPAVYNNSTTGRLDSINAIWGKDQTGLLWWDVSTVRYLDYESFDRNYRWKNWGKLCPGAAIDIYEWVRSPVPPTAWDAYVANSKNNSNATSNGFPQNPSGTANVSHWVETLEWNPTTQKTATVYYFWVKLPTTVPAIPSRTKSAMATAQIIQDPSSSGISYYSVIDQNHVVVGNIRNFTSADCSIKLQWDIGGNQGNFHKEWVLIKENQNQKVESSLWQKMSDSLTGFDSSISVYEVTGKTNENLDLGTNNISITTNTGDIGTLPVTGEIKINDLWFVYSGRIGNKFYGIKNDYGYVVKAGASVYVRAEKGTPNQVPDPTLSSGESLGNLNHPLQSWFKKENGVSSRTARKVFVDIMNSIFSQQPCVDDWYNWTDMLESSERQPTSELYNFTANNFLYRNQLVENNLITEGNTVLLTGQVETNGFWTVWQYSPSHPRSDANGFVLIDSQKWRLQEGEFWEFRDWYATGWDANHYPIYRFDTLAERNNANVDVSLLNGTLVEVANTDWETPRWVRYVFNSNGWNVVGREKATFRLSSRFYTSSDLYGYGSFNLSKIKTRDGTRELRWILDHMASVMSTTQVLQVFLTMVRFAVASDQKIDWVFKTSYMNLGGYTEQMTQNPVAYVNQMPNIIDYIDEVKPYHTKIRDLTSTYSAGPDIARVHVTDFDFPVYQDPALASSVSKSRLLSPAVVDGVVMENPSGNNVKTDTSIVANNFPWADWYNNYTLTSHDRENWTPRRNPVRSMGVKMLLDRVSCEVSTGWSPVDIPWDAPLTIYHGNDTGASNVDLLNEYRTEPPTAYNDIVAVRTSDIPEKAEKLGTIVYSLQDEKTYLWSGKWTEFISLRWDMDTEGGCAGRIKKDYHPTPDMTPNDLSCLLNGCDFRGTTVKGGPIEAGAWDMFPWDCESGWANEFAYYDGGYDYKSTINIHKETYIDGKHPHLPRDVTGRDFDVESVSLKEDLPSTGVIVDGDDIVQPDYAEKHPEEKVPANALSSLTLIVTEDSNRFAITFGNDMSWNYTALKDEGITLVSDNSSYLTVKGGSLHDPANPSKEFLDKVKASFVDLRISEEERKKLLGRLMPGTILVENYRDGKHFIEKIQYWDYKDNSDGTVTLGALQRDYAGVALRPGDSYGSGTFRHEENSKIYDLSIKNWLTYQNHKMKINPIPVPDVKYKPGTRKGNKVWKLGNAVMASRD